jgi:hypothetical protein
VMFNPDTALYAKFFMPVIETAAHSLGVQATAAPIRAAADIEPSLAEFARMPNGGLIVLNDSFTRLHYSLIAAAAQRYRLPSIAGRSGFAKGGLMEYGAPITWTECHLGGRRPWFRCTAYSKGRYCGRRVTTVYNAGDVFACRHCCGLAYASQQEPVRERGILTARKIRKRLGGGPNITRPFPDKPKRMHWRTYDRLRCAHDRAYERAQRGMAKSVERLERWMKAELGIDIRR